MSQRSSGCSPGWRCLRFGCPRCDRERKRDAERRDRWRSIEQVSADPTIGERRAIREQIERQQAAERERRENDPKLN